MKNAFLIFLFSLLSSIAFGQDSNFSYSKSCGMPGNEPCPNLEVVNLMLKTAKINSRTIQTLDDGSYKLSPAGPFRRFSDEEIKELESAGFKVKDTGSRSPQYILIPVNVKLSTQPTNSSYSKSCGMSGNPPCPGAQQPTNSSYSKSCGMPGNPPCPGAKQESYKGCSFLVEGYQILKYSAEHNAKCMCTNKIPDICKATLYCDGSDPAANKGQSEAICPQVKGQCPSLKDCIEDTSVDAPGFDINKYSNSNNIGNSVPK